MQRSIAARYSLFQCVYWGSYCIFSSFGTMYLTANGVSTARAGLLFALTSLAVAFIQPLAGAAADRSARWGLKELILLLGALALAAALALLARGVGVKWLLFCTAFALIQVLQPLINAVGMSYVNRGERLNFGLARGLGSAAYGLTAAVVGSLTARSGAAALPYVAVVFIGLMLLLTLSFSVRREAQGETEADTGSYGSILREHPRLVFFLLGIVSFFTFHMMSNTYMYQILLSLGGNEESLGISTSVAALCELPIMFLFAWLVKKIRVEKLLRLAAVFWLVKAVTLRLAPSVEGVYVNQLLQMLSYGLYVPAGIHFVNGMMASGDTVKGQALITIAFTFGNIAGNLLGGVLIDACGVRQMLSVSCVFAFAAMLLFFAGTERAKVRE